MKPKNILLKDQRRIPMSDMYPTMPILINSQCTESVSTACSYCGMMKTVPTEHNGVECKISNCKLKYWKGTRRWNLLFVPIISRTDVRACMEYIKQMNREMKNERKNKGIQKVAL